MSDQSDKTTEPLWRVIMMIDFIISCCWLLAGVTIVPDSYALKAIGFGLFLCVISGYALQSTSDMQWRNLRSDKKSLTIILIGVTIIQTILAVLFLCYIFFLVLVVAI
jgi:hypothetical protein